MAVFRYPGFDMLAALAVLLLVTVNNPAFAQQTVEPSSELLLPIQNTPNAPAQPQLQVFDLPQQPAVPTFLAPTQPVQPSFQGTPHLDCVASIFQPQSQTLIQVSIATDPAGVVLALPELIGQPSPGRLVRVDYLGLALAIEQCAPYSTRPNPGKHIFDVTAQGTIGITSMPDTPVAAPLNTTGLSIIGAPIPQVDPSFRLSSAETETAVQLDRAAIRDLQARLLVMGFDPNGVDGALGNGARSAYSAWQASIGVVPTGFLSPPQLENLKQVSEEKLTAWLQEPANLAQYKPPQKKKVRQKKRVRVCKKNALGILYDCKYRWR